MPINVGAMDRLVTIEEPTQETSDVLKSKTITWTNFKQAWAAVKSQPKGEITEATQKVGVTQYRFTMRYIPGVTLKMRINYNSKYYYILGVEDRGRNESMVLVTELRDN